MINLSTSRIMQIFIFKIVGVDYAGSFFSKYEHKRSVFKFKSCTSIFICTKIKVVHLKLVSELCTAAFLAALRRFISKRDCSSKIISEKGTIFKSAAKHLKESIQLW